MGKTIFGIVLPSFFFFLFFFLVRQDNCTNCLTAFQLASCVCLAYAARQFYRLSYREKELGTRAFDFSSFSHKTCWFFLSFSSFKIINLLVWILSPKSTETLPIFRLKPLFFEPICCDSRLIRSVLEVLGCARTDLKRFLSLYPWFWSWISKPLNYFLGISNFGDYLVIFRIISNLWTDFVKPLHWIEFEFTTVKIN